MTLTAADLVGIPFAFRVGHDRQLLATGMVLHADGTVSGYDHPNERRWRIEDGRLALCQDDGRETCIFDPTWDAEGRLRLTGPFLLVAHGGPHELLAAETRFIDLTSLANRFGTDKGTSTGDAHGYTEIYAAAFEAFRRDDFLFVELGLLICDGPVVESNPGGRVAERLPSMDMWLAYFPRARCIGFDLSDFSGVSRSRPRFTFIQGDLSSDDDLDRLAAQFSEPPRIIIDDASHAAFHQQRALARLFACLRPGGFYVIEDLHYSPPFESALPACQRMSRIVQRLLDEGRLTLDVCTPAENAALQRSIGHVFVHCSSRGRQGWGPKLVMFQKRAAEFG
jgi:hypothetical protein